MNNIKKIIAGIMAPLVVSSCGLTAYASEKEEVVYVMADAGGSVNGVYVVNSFDGGDVTDYGNYSDVKLMNINGTIKQDGDKIPFTSAENQKVYYQGTMENAEIPWNISIKYFLDGKEYSADEIAGKSGKLEIKVKISENKNCKSDFWKKYALQCSFTLDTKICKNISADGATSANVGSDKQLTYTILPGKGLDRSVKADVTDFEMPAAAINGIRMSLGIDVDSKEIEDKFNELLDGTSELDDGANELYDGGKELKDGSDDLKSGINKLRDGIDSAQSGVDTLYDKSADLTNGSYEVKSALLTIQSSLSSVSAGTDKLEQLCSASTQIKNGIADLSSGITQLKESISYDAYKSALGANGLDIDTLKAGNEQAVSMLSQQIAELEATLSQIESIPEYAGQAAQLNAQIAQLENVITLLSGNNAALGGTETYLNAVSQAAQQLEDGAAELQSKYEEFDRAIGELSDTLKEMLVNVSALSDGIDTLVSEYSKFDSGLSEYADGISVLYSGFSDLADGSKQLADGSKSLADCTSDLVDGAKELSKGTGKLREGTSDMESKVSDELGDTLTAMTDDDYTPVSFVSDKNKDIKSVQFVIKTEAIEIPEAEEPEEEPEKEEGFLQKLLNLFK